MQTTLTANQV